MYIYIYIYVCIWLSDGKIPFLKANCYKAFKNFNVLNPTGNFLFKICLCQPYLHQKVKNAHHNLIHYLTPLKMEEMKDHIRNVMFYEVKNNKNAKENPWKCLSLARSYFYIICSLQNTLNEHKISQEDRVKTYVEKI